MANPQNIGWIKLYRSLMDKAFYGKDSEMVHLWVHLLMKASFSQDKEEYLGVLPYKCAPGEFTTGRRQLALETGINASKVERCLTYFEKIEQQIEQRKTRQNRLIIIKNWHQYQQSEPQNEPQVNHNRTTSEPQVNTLKERKNVRKKECKKKEEIIDYPWFKDQWNSTTSSPIPKVREITDKRKEKIRTRFKENSEFNILFNECLQKIKNNNFYYGNNRYKWVICFDWIIENDTNYIKILEGKYDNRKIETEQEKETREHEEFMKEYRGQNNEF